MSEPLPDEDTAPPIDPFEAELVAYLDGELEPAAARRVEKRLATDAQARAQATALKKTFELLDYLPKSDPSPTFASRTLDKLPALQEAAAQSPKAKKSAITSQGQPKVPQEVLSRNTALRKTSSTQSGVRPLSLPNEPRSQNRLVWAAAVLLAGAGFATAGYLGTAALRTHRPNSESAAAREGLEEAALSDRRLLENLYLYAPIDDYGFANELASPEFFGDEPSVSYDTSLKVPPVAQEVPSDETIVDLEKTFKALPTERQQAIRELDRRLSAASVSTRDRLFRVLECYARWLSALSENDRKSVLAAATPEQRLKQIREVRDQQWLESLTPNQRSRYFGVSETLKRQLLKEWKAEESERRTIWSNARKHPESLDGSKASWPFDNEARREAVLAYAKSALRSDDAKATRLTANEFDRLAGSLNFAQTHGGAAWHVYGKALHELLRKYDDYLLPPPLDPRSRIVDFSELPQGMQKFLPRLKQEQRSTLTALVGKWPEFPLAVHKDFVALRESAKKEVELKALPPLGPSKPGEFQAPIRTFIESELLPKLSEDDKKSLKKEEGKWPEYPRELIHLSRQHDLSMPGVMPPGSPKLWEDLYGRRIK